MRGIIFASAAALVLGGVACSASTDEGSSGFTTAGAGTGNATAGAGGGAVSSAQNTGGFNPTSTASGTGGNTCSAPADGDQDGDGWTGTEGDCNNCDANVNPGAIEVIVTEPNERGEIPEPADEDCDEQTDEVDANCDSGLSVDDGDPMSAARAIDLCQTATVNDKNWGVIEAKYVRATGANPLAPGVSAGILENFGPNVNVQKGERLLALSSGTARLPGQTGACNSNSCYTLGAGSPPPGFPQDVGCGGESNINDDIGFEVTVRAPSNATGYRYRFKFYSFEYPEWVCTEFNDQYIALVNPPPQGAVNGNISFDSQNNPVSVNVAFFDVTGGHAELQGTGFDGSWGDDAGGTSWLQSQAPVVGGSQVTIRFTIWDTGDQAWDSTAVVDAFEWIANGGTVAIGTGTVPDPR